MASVSKDSIKSTLLVFITIFIAIIIIIIIIIIISDSAVSGALLSRSEQRETES